MSKPEDAEDAQEELVVRFAEAVSDAIAQGSDLANLELTIRFLDGDGEPMAYQWIQGDESSLGPSSRDEG